MFCYKCGTELPDDAQFCYKCGNKTARVEDVNCEDNKDVEENKIINTFYIGESKIEFNKSESKELLIISLFQRNADISTYFLRSFGMYEIKTFEECYDKYYQKFIEILRQNLSIAVKFLMKLGIDTYDRDAIWELMLEYYDLESEMEEYYADLYMVEDRIKELDEDAQKRKNDKNPWRGGGFGLSGAIKGAILAGVLNAGSNFIGNIEDGIINSLDKKEIQRLKQECFESQRSLHILGNILYDLVRAMGTVVYYSVLIEENKAEKNNWSYEKMISRRNNLVEMYNQSEINEMEIIERLCKCYEQYPFSLEIHETIFALDRGLLTDILNLYRVNGRMYHAKRYIYDLGHYHTHAYYTLFVKHENDCMPKLIACDDIVEKILNDDLDLELSQEDQQKINRIWEYITWEYTIFDMLTGTIRQAKGDWGVILGNVLASEDDKDWGALGYFFASKDYFEKPVKEIIINRGVGMLDAVKGILDFHKDYFDEVGLDEEAIKILKEKFFEKFYYEAKHHLEEKELKLDIETCFALRDELELD